MQRPCLVIKRFLDGVFDDLPISRVTWNKVHRGRYNKGYVAGLLRLWWWRLTYCRNLCKQAISIHDVWPDL